jgi:hypothetical protein
MKDSYVTFFGVREAPFTKEIPDGDLWLPPSKEQVIDELCDAIV